GGSGGNGSVVGGAAGPGVVPVSGVPEPSSWMLLVAGFGVVGATMRGRKLESA
ncbi:MAG: PEPxxWA-CTERM sorting domain-containing protein, partial [Sphingomonadaceae bacterium]|nr:PEPxxWA-CTERM sorting domain-containing protein [Sphingomonadaceae bacterium]